MRRSTIGRWVGVVLLLAQAALADELAPGLVDASGDDRVQLLYALQATLRNINPDAVIEYCTVVLKAPVGERADADDRFGAACGIQDGLSQRRMLLCVDPRRAEVAIEELDQDDRDALVDFIERQCPSGDRGPPP